jgi:hypothetical protein
LSAAIARALKLDVEALASGRDAGDGLLRSARADLAELRVERRAVDVEQHERRSAPAVFEHAAQIVVADRRERRATLEPATHGDL